MPRTSETATEDKSPAARAGLEIVENGGYPEFHVDGKPFFIHAAAFFYYRIPADEWAHLLKVYRSYGINTIDLYIPWNWHEPSRGEFDFDGHTNPRRNLRGLLAMINGENLKIIARPGPEILNEWRHGGYPGWLLDQPEFKMDPFDWIEGRYAPLDNLNATDTEAAAEGWLANGTHMEESRKWLTAVAKELAQYSARRIVHVESEGKGIASRDLSGPLIFAQLGDDFAIGRSNHVGPEFWRYVGALRGAVEAGGVNVPVFINPTDMRVSAAGSDLVPPIGVMGQWYLERRPGSAAGVRRFTAGDAGEIEFFTEELKTQPAFPPVMIEYQAGWYTPGDDDGPMASPPENTLLSSRLLIANGVHGLNYFPLQDTLSPAGYSVPWANRSYRWDAALAPDGGSQPRVHAVIRNWEILQRWNGLLAASHKRADFGIIYPMAAYPQERLQYADVAFISSTVMKIERVAGLAMLSNELIDPQYQPVEQMLRNPVTLLPVFDPSKLEFQLSEKAQSTIVEYVRRGGTLVVFPEKPSGAVIERLWQGMTEKPPSENSAIRARWKFGEGTVIFSSKDFYSWIALEHALPELGAAKESAWTTGALREFLQATGVAASVKGAGGTKNSASSDLLINEIISNDGTDALGVRKSGQGFLSVTNLSLSETAEESLEVLSTVAPARGGDPKYDLVNVTVPAHESLLLPLEQPICFADPANAPCGDELTTASAEFLDAHREGKTLDLLFYAPTRAEVQLRLTKKPIHIALDMNRMEGVWTDSEHKLVVTIAKGAAPEFLRVLSLDLPEKPQVPEAEKPVKPGLDDLGYFVANAIQLPTGSDVGMRTYPPLIAVDKNRSYTAVIQAENQTGVPNLSVDLSVSGAMRGSGTLRLIPRGVSVEKVQLKPSPNDSAVADGLIHAAMELRMGRERKMLPLAFLQARDDGIYHYRYDFDRDGADEWVLENSNLRVIVSPESGGRALAMVEKTSGENLATSVGLFRDNFSYTPNPEGVSETRARGRYGLFNRWYGAKWQSETGNPILNLQYDAPDTFPSGASIEKTIQFEDASRLRVKYTVTLKSGETGKEPTGNHQQAFVAVNSVPALARPGRVTRFCWPTERNSEEEKDKPKSKNTGWKCQDFDASGNDIELPAGTRRLEVRTTGRAATIFEWDCEAECGRMTIEPKHFSALLRLQFPPLSPGGPAGKYTMHIRMDRGE